MNATDDRTGTVVLTVPAMTCAHCEAAVTAELSAIEGVTAVTVDLDAKVVSVDFHGPVPQRSRLEAAIDEAGFELADIALVDDQSSAG